MCRPVSTRARNRASSRTTKRINEDLRDVDGLEWISALRSEGIRSLVDAGKINRTLFDEKDLAEISDEEHFPGERLIVCRNPLHGEDAIGLAVGQVIGNHKMNKHFELTITENSFSYVRRQENIAAEAALDGLSSTGHGSPHLRMFGRMFRESLKTNRH